MILVNNIICGRVGIATRNNRLPISVGSPFTSNNLNRGYQNVTQKNKTFHSDLSRAVRLRNMAVIALVFKAGLYADKAKLQSKGGRVDNSDLLTN